MDMGGVPNIFDFPYLIGGKLRTDKSNVTMSSTLSVWPKVQNKNEAM